MRKALLTAVVLTIAPVGAITVLPAIASPLFQPPPPKCRSLAGDRVVLSSGQVTVYRGTAPGRHGIHDWVCARSKAPATPLGADPGTERFPSRERIALLVAAGPWVAAFESSAGGFRPCLPAVPSHCPPYHHQVELIEAGGASSSSAGAGARVETLHMSSIRRSRGTRIGVVVWLQRLHGSIARLSSMVDVSRRRSGSGSSGMVATGRIAPGSVRLVGLRVRFVENGRRRSVRLSDG